jgi:transcription initiation factor TFIID subunit 11
MMIAEATKLLQENFSESQQDRYEAYRRSTLKEGAVRKVMSSVTTLNLPKISLVAVRGAAKLYVGELIEEARTIMDENEETGAIRPWHIREA